MFDENIINLFFNSSGFLYEEPHNLLVQEFKNAPLYDDVIYTMANGANRVTEIKDKTKLESTSVHEYMGEIFEKMCRNNVLLNAFSSSMPFFISEVGKWNGSNPAKKEQTDIDVVGVNQSLKMHY